MGCVKRGSERRTYRRRKGRGRLPENHRGIGRLDYYKMTFGKFHKLLLAHSIDIHPEQLRLMLLQAYTKVIPNANGKYNDMWKMFFEEWERLQEQHLKFYNEDIRYRRFTDYLNSALFNELLEEMKQVKSTKARIDSITAMTLAYIEDNYKTPTLKPYLELEQKYAGFIPELWSKQTLWTMGLTGLKIFEEVLEREARNIVFKRFIESATGELRFEIERSWLDNRDDYVSRIGRYLVEDLPADLIQTIQGEIGSVFMTELLRRGTVAGLHFLADGIEAIAKYHPLARRAGGLARLSAEFLNKSIFAWIGWQVAIEWRIDGWLQIHLIEPILTAAGLKEEKFGGLTKQEIKDLIEFIAKVKQGYVPTQEWTNYVMSLWAKANPNLVNAIINRVEAWMRAEELLKMKKYFEPQNTLRLIKPLAGIRKGKIIDELISAYNEGKDLCVKEIAKKDMDWRRADLGFLTRNPKHALIVMLDKAPLAVALPYRIHDARVENKFGSIEPRYWWRIIYGVAEAIGLRLRLSDVCKQSGVYTYVEMKVTAPCAIDYGNTDLAMFRYLDAVNLLLENKSVFDYTIRGGNIRPDALEKLNALLRNGYYIKEARRLSSAVNYFALTLQKDEIYLKPYIRRNCISVRKIRRVRRIMLPPEPLIYEYRSYDVKMHAYATEIYSERFIARKAIMENGGYIIGDSSFGVSFMVNAKALGVGVWRYGRITIQVEGNKIIKTQEESKTVITAQAKYKPNIYEYEEDLATQCAEHDMGLMHPWIVYEYNQSLRQISITQNRKDEVVKKIRTTEIRQDKDRQRTGKRTFRKPKIVCVPTS